ncbi:MAG: EpsI family protein, partial [Betaproteobacteria bacterium]|nr:EpsI family protein [Betaproteobacteria bacterium]
MSSVTLRGPSIRMRAWLIAALLIAAAALPKALRPATETAQTQSVIDLASMVPAQFAGWRTDTATIPEPVSPGAVAKASGAYAQTLERIYVDTEQRRIMLSIAYGDRQLGDALQAHRPEYCYAAQGFTVAAASDSVLATSHAALPIRRLQAYRPGRRELVSYWLTVGDQATLPGLSRKIAQLRYGLGGTLPDGMLVRVSSIDDSTAAAYALQDRFIVDL